MSHHNRRLESLTIEDVQNLLSSLNMNNYRETFFANEIDGQTLDAIESASELIDLGISIPAKANLLLKKIISFKESGVPSRTLMAQSSSAVADFGEKVEAAPKTPVQHPTHLPIPSRSASPAKRLQDRPVHADISISKLESGGSRSAVSKAPRPNPISSNVGELDDLSLQYSPISSPPSSRDASPGPLGQQKLVQGNTNNKDTTVRNQSIVRSDAVGNGKGKEFQFPHVNYAGEHAPTAAHRARDALEMVSHGTQQQFQAQNQTQVQTPQGQAQGHSQAKTQVQGQAQSQGPSKTKPFSQLQTHPDSQQAAQLPIESPSSTYTVTEETAIRFLSEVLSESGTASGKHSLVGLHWHGDTNASILGGDDDMSISIFDQGEYDLLEDYEHHHIDGIRSPGSIVNAHKASQRKGRGSSYHRSWLHQLKANMHSPEFVIKMLTSLRYLLLNCPADNNNNAGGLDSNYADGMDEMSTTLPMSYAEAGVRGAPDSPTASSKFVVQSMPPPPPPPGASRPHKSIFTLVQDLFLQQSLCDTVSEIIRIHSHYTSSGEMAEVPTSTLLYSPGSPSPRHSQSPPGAGEWDAQTSVVFSSMHAMQLALVFLTNCLLALGPVSNEVLCNVVVDVLWDHEMAIDVVNPALLVLALLARNDENTSHLASLEICPLIGTICSRYADNLSVLESGLLSVSSLADVENQRILLAGSDVGMCTVILGGLAHHWRNVNIAMASLQCLNKLCYDAIYSMDHEDEQELCAILVRIIDYHILAGCELHSTAFRSLEILSGSFLKHESIQSSNFNTDNIEAFTRSGVCHAICSVMREYLSAEDIIIAGCRLILIESLFSVEARSLLFDATVCELLAAILTLPEYQINESVVEIAFRCINSLLTANNENTTDGPTKNLCLIYKSILKMHARNELLVVLGLQNVCLLGEIGLTNKIVLCATGTIQSLIRLLHMNATNLAIVEAGFMAIAAAMKDLPSAISPQQLQFVTSSNITGAMASMTTLTNSSILNNSGTFPGSTGMAPGSTGMIPGSSGASVGWDDGSVLGSGAAERQLAANSHPSSKSGATTTTITFTTAECHEMIHLLRTYSWHLGIVSAGLQAMRYLMHHPPIKGALIRHGIAVAVVDALKKHVLEPFVASGGLWVINAMAYKSTTNNFSSANVALKSSGVHAVVVMVLQTHISDPEVTEAGLRAISVLAANAVCRAALAQAGACSCVLQALSRHIAVQPASVSVTVSGGTHPAIAKYSCSALFYLIYGNTANAVQVKLLGAKAILKDLIINNGLITDEWTKAKARDVILILNKAV